MAKVSKDMLIGQLLQIDANIAPILMRAGMHCRRQSGMNFGYIIVNGVNRNDITAA